MFKDAVLESGIADMQSSWMCIHSPAGERYELEHSFRFSNIAYHTLLIH